jgi:hypothetical protein
VEVGQRCPKRLVIHRIELRSSHDPLACESSRSSDRGCRGWVVARNDDCLDARLCRLPQRFRDADPKRVGEGQDRPGPPGLARHAARKKKQPPSGIRSALDRGLPRVEAVDVPAQGQDRLGCPQRKLFHEAIALGSSRGVGLPVAGRTRLQ